jgi:hypothetical protein
VKFLSCDAGLTLGKYRRKHLGMYDVIYLSSGNAHRIAECGDLLTDGGHVIVEGARLVTNTINT